MYKKRFDEQITTATTTLRTTSSVSPRHLIITRTSGKPSSDGACSSSKVTRTTTTTLGDAAFSEGAYATMTSTGVNQVKMTRDQEKKDMKDLNDRFAVYINKVRSLEAQNRHLADELAKLKFKWGKETSQVKALFQTEVDEARQALDEAGKETARLEVRASTLGDLLEELQAKLTVAVGELATNKEKVVTQTNQISNYENEIQLLRKQLDGLENEKEKDRKKIGELREALTRAREDLDHETLAHVDSENRRRTLEEQTEFLKSVHEEEMREMTVLAYRDSQPESRDFWKHEMTQAVNEIRQMYDDKLEAMRGEMESNCTIKVQEMQNMATKQDAETIKSKEDCNILRTTITDIRDKINKMEMKNAQLAREIEALRRSKADVERELEAENASLRTDSNRLRAELDSIMRELQAIMNTKMGLELEIAAYRKLLEGEENRISLKVASSSRMSSFVEKSAKKEQAS